MDNKEFGFKRSIIMNGPDAIRKHHAEGVVFESTAHDSDGLTFGAYAIMKNIETVVALSETGYKFNDQADRQGRTVGHLAAQKGLEMVRTLHKAGYQFKPHRVNNATPATLIIGKGGVDGVAVMDEVNYPFLDEAPTKSGKTPSELEAMRKGPAVVEALQKVIAWQKREREVSATRPADGSKTGGSTPPING